MQRAVRTLAGNGIEKDIPMTLFKSQVHQDIWIEHHCERCARNPDCPIVLRAITTGRKPVEWKRNPRKNVLMQDTIKCEAECRTLPRQTKRVDMEQDCGLFDIEPHKAGLVPVDGWPDRPTKDGVDHA
jgi:hypothetical protein